MIILNSTPGKEKIMTAQRFRRTNGQTFRVKIGMQCLSLGKYEWTFLELIYILSLLIFGTGKIK